MASLQSAASTDQLYLIYVTQRQCQLTTLQKRTIPLTNPDRQVKRAEMLNGLENSVILTANLNNSQSICFPDADCSSSSQRDYRVAAY